MDRSVSSLRDEMIEKDIKGSLVMGGRDPLEEDLGPGRIHIEVDPPSPCGEALVERDQPVHVPVVLSTVLHVIPPAHRSEF